MHMEDTNAYAELVRQHIALLQEIDRMWTVLVLLVFLMLVGTVCMVVCAILIYKKQRDLEAKFTLLIDVLLEQARYRNEELQRGNA